MRPLNQAAEAFVFGLLLCNSVPDPLASPMHPDPPSVVVLPSGGRGERWHRHLGVPKQLAAPEGEPVLARALRLLSHQAPAAAFYIPIREPFPRPLSTVPALYFETRPVLGHKVDKVLCGERFWSDRGRTLIVFGDVWLTEAAARSLCSPWPRELERHEVRWFGRYAASQITGKTSGETFGLDFWPEAHYVLRYGCEAVTDLRWAGATQVWRLLDFGLPTAPKGWHSHRHVEINDWTEDFDRPADYSRWTEARARAREEGRPL